MGSRSTKLQRRTFSGGSIFIALFLSAVALLPAAGSARAEDAPARTTDNSAPSCSFDPQSLGLTVFGKYSVEKGQKASDSYLRARTFRLVPTFLYDVSRPLEEGTGLEIYDLMVLFHVPEKAVEDKISSVVNQIPNSVRWFAEGFCDFRKSDTTTYYDPFIRTDPDTGESVVANDIMVFARRTTFPVQKSGFQFIPDAKALLRMLPRGMPSKDAIASAIEAAPALDEPEPKTWERNNYPWVADLDFGGIEPGDAVFALDKIKCDDRGNFIVGTIGEAAAKQPADSKGAIAVVRRKMIASNVYFGASGNPTDKKAVAESVNEKEYWCIPKREFCFQQIDFGDFGIDAERDGTDQFSGRDVFSMSHGFVPVLEKVVMDNCPREIVTVKGN